MGNKRFEKSRLSQGSALILTVVLTSLLAIVGVLFVLVSRLSKMETSAISENKELNLAVDAVVAKISQELVLDVPGVAGQEYYDYPDINNAWLACLEPYKSGSNYYWRQISGVTGYLAYRSWSTQNVEITNNAPDLFKAIIEDHKQIVLEPNGLLLEQLADADGDGVADSKWIELTDITSSKGKPIFAAVRVIDNGGMLNVNTAYKFDPNEPIWRVDGSSQMQINLMALSWRPGITAYNANDETDLLTERANPIFGLDPNNLNAYEQNVIWRYGKPNGAYTPFDISDELELRYRFLVNQEDIDTRLEVLGLEHGRDWEFRTINDFRTPAGRGDLDEWFKSAYDNGSFDPNYAYRHIATTYNMDRIINPLGSTSTLNSGKMVNINRVDGGNPAALYTLFRAIYAGLKDGKFGDDTTTRKAAAQLAVNIADYRDADANVAVWVAGEYYYGFERPCIYISEIAYNFAPPQFQDDSNHISYAIELYKPYLEDEIPTSGSWRLNIGSIDIGPWSGGKTFYVIKNEDNVAPLDINDANVPNNPQLVFSKGTQIVLQRWVNATANYINVDSISVPAWLADPNTTGLRSLQRDITKHKCIRRLWDTRAKTPTLGSYNKYENGDSIFIQAHPANKDFTNIGEIGMVFVKSAYSEGPNPIGPNDTEATARLNLADPNYQQIFKYLTVFDPNTDLIDNDGDGLIDEIDLAQTPECKILGRININTAPWFVLAQLPWVSAHTPNYELAKAIVERRETEGAFKNIGELNLVGIVDPNPFRSIGYYARTDGPAVGDQLGFPDLTPDDKAEDDFEERDLIFSRISNLVTVRSDVFTAYILVRIGTDGPQKRVMAILDRSNVGSASDKVRVVALHPVPDPR